MNVFWSFLRVSVSSAFYGSLTGPLLFQKQDAVGGTKLNAEDTEKQRKFHSLVACALLPHLVADAQRNGNFVRGKAG